jgi:general secretion pathway protein A
MVNSADHSDHTAITPRINFLNTRRKVAMYQSHWGLKEPPFHDGDDSSSFYQSPTHEEALARLHFLVEQHRRLGLLLGPEGSGKSLLLGILASQLRRRGPVVARVNLTGICGDEMLWSLAGQFGRNLDRCDSTPVLWRALTDRLAAFRYQLVDAVILIDDADRAGNSVVPHLIRLAKLDAGPQPRLTLVLAGDRLTIGRLGETLLGLSELRIDLQAWQADDIVGYLDRSLRQAGGTADMFAEPAIERLHELSHGIPRQVRLLADLSLVAGAGRHLQTIDADVVDSVYHELATVDL